MATMTTSSASAIAVRNAGIDTKMLSLVNDQYKDKRVSTNLDYDNIKVSVDMLEYSHKKAASFDVLRFDTPIYLSKDITDIERNC